MGNDNVKDYPQYLDYPKPRKPIPSGDRIRRMSDEELAEFVIGVLCYTKPPYMEVREKALRDNELLDWLKQEAVSNG